MATRWYSWRTYQLRTNELRTVDACAARDAPPPGGSPVLANTTPAARFLGAAALSRSCGFTLLEVVLALAILAASVAMLGELIRYASRSANDAQAETRAQLLAISLMDQMVVGVIQPAQQSREPLEVDDSVDWVYSVDLQDTELAGLTAVEVVVEQDLDDAFHPVRYQLVRWLPDVPTTSEESETPADDQEAAAGGQEADDG